MPLFYQHENLHIYFGDASSALSPHDHGLTTTSPSVDKLFAIPGYANLKKDLQLEHLMFLRQEHRTKGVFIEHAQSLIPFSDEGDFLATQLPKIGIGVLTADCVPVVIYAPDIHAVSVVHAGWRGVVDGIVLIAALELRNRGAQPGKLQIFIGPCAKVCCYEVQAHFYHVMHPDYQSDAIFINGGHHFFDMPLLIQMQLQELGISSEQINSAFNFCTICNHSFYSHRRQGPLAGRQMTVVALLRS